MIFTAAISDDATDPEHVVLDSDEPEHAVDFLSALPDQRRKIFWRGGEIQLEIAADFGIHKRPVQKELNRAERYLRKKMLRPKLAKDRPLSDQQASDGRSWDEPICVGDSFQSTHDDQVRAINGRFLHNLNIISAMASQMEQRKVAIYS